PAEDVIADRLTIDRELDGLADLLLAEPSLRPESQDVDRLDVAIEDVEPVRIAEAVERAREIGFDCRGRGDIDIPSTQRVQHRRAIGEEADLKATEGRRATDVSRECRERHPIATHPRRDAERASVYGLALIRLTPRGVGRREDVPRHHP